MGKSNRAFKSKKRSKELKRQKKQEEKRKKRLGLEEPEPSTKESE
jgi:hypothetical protein